MDSKELRALMESYSAVYQDENDLQEDLSVIDELTEEELEEIVEEVIVDLLDEGYSIDDVDLIFEGEEIFEEVILEMNPYAPAGSKAARQYARATSASKRGAARAEKVARVKGAVKSALGKAKSAVKSGIERGKSVARKVVDEPARKYAEKRGVVSSKSGKSALGSGTGIGSVAFKQRTSAGRKEVRSAVAKDVAGRVRKKAASAAVSAYAAARSAKQAASDVAGRTKQSAKNLAARTARELSDKKQKAKGGIKSGIGKLARKVAKKAGSVASRLGEEVEVDLYDLVLEHLVENGYAETEEAALAIMANMGEEWRNSILEQSAIASRTAKVVDDQRQGYHGDSDAINKLQNATSRSIGKLKRGQGPVVTPGLPGV